MRRESSAQRTSGDRIHESIVSPEDQGATFVELFFDLVFVFAITQITQYAAHHLHGPGILRSVVISWLIWWGWTQFTWALNAATFSFPLTQS